MNSNRTRLLAGIVSAIVLSAPLAQALAPNLTLTNFTGTLRIAQGVPCGGVVEAKTTVAGGRMDIAPVIARGEVVGQFYLTTRVRIRPTSNRKADTTSSYRSDKAPNQRNR